MAAGTARRIAFNFLSLLGSELLSKALQLLIFIFLARSLGAEQFGVFSFGIAFALLIVFIADFGLSTLMIREVSRNKNLASKYLSNAIVLKIFLSAVSIAAAYLFLTIVGYDEQFRIVTYIMLAFTILQSFTDIFYSIFRSFERMYYDAALKVLRVAILGSFVAYAIKNEFGLIGASLAFPVTEVIILALAAIAAYSRFVRVSFDFDFDFSRKMLKQSALFCLSLVFAGLFLYTDTLMLSKMRPLAEVGIYSAAANIMLALMFIPLMYGNAIYPVISRYFMSSKESLGYAYERSFKYMLLLGLPASICIFMLSDEIIFLFYGEGYSESAMALKILSGYLFLRFLNVISGFTLSSINRQGSRVLSQGTAAVVSITLNLFLIPVYGFIGAAAAVLATEVIFFLVYFSFVRKYGIRIRLTAMVMKAAVPSLIMLLVLLLVNSPLIGFISSIFAYLAGILIFGAIDKEDKRILKKVVDNA